ncbi:MAG: family 10 glycosylhydrolase [bacterium]
MLKKEGQRICLLAFVLAVSYYAASVFAQGTGDLPKVEREFRAVWVATVANIDWPTSPGLSTEVQKQQAIAILDKIKELQMNAVVLQVRAQADAFYKSDLEPWSYYLTGQEGKAPDPYYDPLEFWVEEAHARGLELHTWFNPYRANHPARKGEMSEKSVVKAHPELVVKLGDRGYYWMDPALKGTQDHSLAVVMDIVTRYDVDGIHFDDYFYPYPEYNGGKDFPDDASWEAYQKSGGKLSRDDWRREAVNVFIKAVYDGKNARKPWVKFGLSPFGIWQPGYPESIRGFNQYGVLYADAKLWLNKGWVDYYTPQLYWQISRIPQSFPVLLGWWASENTQHRHLWPGMTIGQARSEAGVTEVVNQIMVARGIVPQGPGHCFFSMRTLQTNRGGLNEALLKGPYQQEALVPASPWLDDKPPAAPGVTAKKQGDQVSVQWQAKGSEKIFLWVLYVRRGDKWSYQILPSQQLSVTESSGGEREAISAVAVVAVDRVGNESKPAMGEIQP